MSFPERSESVSGVRRPRPLKLNGGDLKPWITLDGKPEHCQAVLGRRNSCARFPPWLARRNEQHAIETKLLTCFLAED
jgi:hypothetical protein